MEPGDALTIEFATERFDYRGELSDDKATASGTWRLRVNG